jgi:hypothetical protein
MWPARFQPIRKLRLPETLAFLEGERGKTIVHKYYSAMVVLLVFSAVFIVPMSFGTSSRSP